MSDFRAVARTDVGRKRDHNEDRVMETGLRGGGHMLAVADGMGGHAAGEVASQTALTTFHERIAEEVGPDSGPISSRDMLEAAVETANAAVIEAARGDPERGNMGTTLVAALVLVEGALVVNVGDSRAYLIHDHPDPRIEQITIDQSIVRELVEEGKLSPEEARGHPRRHVLAQSLGVSLDVEPDFFSTPLGEGTLLLCSDGLTEEVSDDAIARIVAAYDDLDTTARALIERANENGGSDNVSVVLGRRA